MNEKPNPYLPPDSTPRSAAEPNSRDSAPWPLRVLFGMLAIGFLYGFVFIGFRGAVANSIVGCLLYALIIFQCAHVAVSGRWFGIRGGKHGL